MTRPEAWALFAAHALGGFDMGAALDGRVRLAAVVADKMTDEWVARLEGPPQRDPDAEVIAERRDSKRRKGAGA